MASGGNREAVESPHFAACAPTREDPPEQAGGTAPNEQEAAEPGAAPEDAEPGTGADVSRRDPGDGGDSRNP